MESQKEVKPARPMTPRVFTQKVTTLCKSLGAVLIEPPSTLTDRGGSYQVETLYGPLTICAFGDWIACRFLDTKRAGDFLGWTSKISGKWNFHGGQYLAGRGKRCIDRAGLIEEFTAKLTKIVVAPAGVESKVEPVMAREPELATA